MELKERMKSFEVLGNFLRAFPDSNNEQTTKLKDIVTNDHIYNPWFTENNIKKSIRAIGDSLTPDNIEKWVNKYPQLHLKKESKNIGVITAGNIPLVGFHDFISVLMTGHKFIGKLSSKDNRLLNFIIKQKE